MSEKRKRFEGGWEWGDILVGVEKIQNKSVFKIMVYLGERLLFRVQV